MTTPANTLTLTLNVESKNAQANLNAIGDSVKQLGQVTESTFTKQDGMGVLGDNTVAKSKLDELGVKVQKLGLETESAFAVQKMGVLGNNTAAKASLDSIGDSVKKLGLMTETAFAKENMGVLGVKSFAEVKAEMAKLTTAYRGLATSGKASAGEQAKALESLRTKQRELYATISNPPKLDLARSVLGVSSQQSIVAEINKVKQAYATLASSGKASLAELSRAKIAMGQKIDELKRKTNNWRDALGEIKGRMIEAAAASAGMVLAAKAGIDFESAMADVRKVVNGTPAEIDALGKSLIGLTRTIPMSAIELAKIATAGGQLGIAAKDILPFVDVTAKMATAFDMTAEEAGNAIGKLKNVFNLSIEEIGQFGDAINQLGNNSAAREKDIVEVMLRVGGTSRQFGLAKEQTAALAAAMLSLGKPPEVAATSINTLLNRMQTATMQSGDFQEALAKIGMSAEGMASAVAQNPQQALTNLLDTLAKLDGQDRAEVLTGLFGREFQDDIGVLVGSLQTYRDTLGQVGDENSYAGAMLEEFKKKAETTSNQLTLLKNEVVMIAINIGTGLLPAIKSGAALLTALLKPISDLTGAFPKLSATIVGLGTGAIVFKTVASAVGILRSALTIFGVDSVTSLGRVGTAVSKLAPLFKMAGGVIAAFGVGWEIGSFLNKFDVVQKAGIAMASGITRAMLKAKQAWAWVSGGDTAAIQRELEEAERIYYGMFANVGKEAKKAAATQITEQKKVTTGAEASANTQTAAQKKATDAMKAAYKSYADTVKQLQADIADREKSLTRQLRSMNRSDKPELYKLGDIKAEGEEYIAAARDIAKKAQDALASGDNAAAQKLFKDAVQYADDAKQAFEELHASGGDKVLKTAAAGVEESGRLAIEMLRQMEEASKNAASELNKMSGGTLLADLKKESPELAAMFDELQTKTEDLAGKSEKFNKQWNAAWDDFLKDGKGSIHELDKQLTELTKDRNINVYVSEVQKRMHGGLIGSVQRMMHGGSVGLKMATGGAVAGVRNMLAGGHFPGFGGGDRRHVVAEDGEYMLDKFRVRDARLDVVQAFHAGDYGYVVQELMKRMRGSISRQVGGIINRIPTLPAMPQYMQAGGSVVGASGSGGDVLRHEHNLRTADGRQATVYTDDLNADRLIGILRRAEVMSS